MPCWPADRQADRQTGRQAETDRQTHRLTDSQTKKYTLIKVSTLSIYIPSCAY